MDSCIKISDRSFNYDDAKANGCTGEGILFEDTVFGFWSQVVCINLFTSNITGVHCYLQVWLYLETMTRGCQKLPSRLMFILLIIYYYYSKFPFMFSLVFWGQSYKTFRGLFRRLTLLT